ncbi:hypothetical protein SY88_02565 [Clostridiales bacterium PH28_bin88]|nr:hypothetical protein SY88_02565 [Clostridiales bacterium PH28_bin88]
MPLVLKSCATYGERENIHLLASASGFAQSEETLRVVLRRLPGVKNANNTRQQRKKWDATSPALAAAGKSTRSAAERHKLPAHLENSVMISKARSADLRRL